MSKYEKALNNLMKLIKNNDLPSAYENNDILKELIEKEKPEKVVEHIDNNRGFCSNCGTLVYKNEIYCNRCGHKQDWSTS